MTDYAAHRNAMVETQLRTNDVTDRRVLSAMGSVPRERFVPEHQRPFAYIDRDLVLTRADAAGATRCLMQPATFAKLLQLAAVGPDDRVLDVGAAGGYSAAILARLCREVVAVESDPDLAAAAREALAEVGHADTKLVVGPLDQGAPGESRFDVILLEGAVEVVPDALLDQLAEGGRLVGIVGTGRSARATLFERLQGGIVSRADFDRAAAPLPGFSTPAAFVF